MRTLLGLLERTTGDISTLFNQRNTNSRGDTWRLERRQRVAEARGKNNSCCGTGELHTCTCTWCGFGFASANTTRKGIREEANTENKKIRVQGFLRGPLGLLSGEGNHAPHPVSLLRRIATFSPAFSGSSTLPLSSPYHYSSAASWIVCNFCFCALVEWWLRKLSRIPRHVSLRDTSSLYDHSPDHHPQPHTPPTPLSETNSLAPPRPH